MKKATPTFGPITIAAIRVATGAITLALLMLISKTSWKLNKKEYFPIILIAITSTVIPYSIQPYLIGDYGSGFIGMMVSLVPIMTIIISVPLLKIYPSRLQIVGVLLGMGCLTILFSEGLDRNIPTSKLVLALIVPLCYAFSNTYIKRNMANIHPLSMTVGLLSVASIILLPVGGVSETIKTTEPILPALTASLILGIAGSGFAIYLFYKLIQKQGPLFAGMVTYLIPIFALLWGWLDAEKVTITQLTVMAGIIFSVILVQLGHFKKKEAKQQIT